MAGRSASIYTIPPTYNSVVMHHIYMYRHSYDRGSAREVHEGRRPASSAPEPQLCHRQEEKAASDKYDDDEENFKDLPSILSSGWEIDSVSDSGASNTPQEQAGPAPCPPSPQPPAAAAATSISLPIGN